jgi:hypothetical protein
LLTASYPFNFSLTTWEGRSKDHGVVDEHVLHVYAIGMKVGGMSRDDLRAHISLTVETSAIASHPLKYVRAPGDEHMLGGGAKITYSGPGSMLVESYPQCSRSATSPDRSCSSWLVKAKDHVFSDPSTITIYGISIKPNLPGRALPLHVLDRWDLGPVKFGGRSSVSFEIPENSVLTGLGARSLTGTGDPGRMLTRMGPEPGTANLIFEDKDHLEISGGQVWGFATYVQR